MLNMAAVQKTTSPRIIQPQRQQWQRHPAQPNNPCSLITNSSSKTQSESLTTSPHSLKWSERCHLTSDTYHTSLPKQPLWWGGETTLYNKETTLPPPAQKCTFVSRSSLSSVHSTALIKMVVPYLRCCHPRCSHHNHMSQLGVMGKPITSLLCDSVHLQDG